ncbi:DNA-methyltransferase [Sinanaerobacter sp. ZZT-01]|uniref:DNA-methyltransferase n=1 Tax=Sinanaerobacter sp. ZZT-01 TaxID=3111540 RepID=UPI002D798EA6|nr:DNA methyltransferase [Sinanaerobacter sp. ZZT-01]WRR92689.1 DNA methyltransferase [Sinanaerobacter sp. ZZT-01]
MKNIVRLLQGDCNALFEKLEDSSIDLIVTDPPYGVGYSVGFDDSLEYVKSNIEFWLKQMYRVLKEGRHCYIFIPTKQAGLWLSQIQEVFTFNNILTVRNYTTSQHSKNNFQYNNQLIVYCSKGIPNDLHLYDFFKTSESWLNDSRNKNPNLYTYTYPAFIGSCFANVKRTRSKQDNGHPCAKNPELLRLLVNLSSNPGDVVFDPFMGGGSTGLTALNEQRGFIGFEKNTEYFNTLKESFESVAVWRDTTIQYD